MIADWEESSAREHLGRCIGTYAHQRAIKLAQAEEREESGFLVAYIASRFFYVSRRTHFEVAFCVVALKALWVNGGIRRF